LLTLAASETPPCLELALRLRVGEQFKGRVHRKGKPRPPATLPELFDAAIGQDQAFFNSLLEDAGIASRFGCNFAQEVNYYSYKKIVGFGEKK
jgi:hypothetical protein